MTRQIPAEGLWRPSLKAIVVGGCAEKDKAVLPRVRFLLYEWMMLTHVSEEMLTQYGGFI
jgi:hypothetical protein